MDSYPSENPCQPVKLGNRSHFPGQMFRRRRWIYELVIYIKNQCHVHVVRRFLVSQVPLRSSASVRNFDLPNSRLAACVCGEGARPRAPWVTDATRFAFERPIHPSLQTIRGSRGRDPSRRQTNGPSSRSPSSRRELRELTRQLEFSGLGQVV